MSKLPPGTVEIATDVGPLLLPSDDEVMRPLIERTHDWEIDEATLFRALIRPGATVLDIGAHVGYYTLLSARAAGRRGRVIAFEPHPANAGLLRVNVQRNRLGKAGAHCGGRRMGISDDAAPGAGN